MVKAVSIAGIDFKTKKVAVAHIRRLIDECGVGVPGDQEFFRALLDMHPRASEKIGVGVRRIEIGPNIVDPDGGYTLWVLRLDGTRHKWGYRKCLHTHAPHNVYSACRLAVSGDVGDFKLAHLGDLDHEQAEVHHDTPFKELVDDWRQGRDDFEYTRGGSHAIGGRFADPEIEVSFRNYHREHARLRVLHVDEHRKVTRERR